MLLTHTLKTDTLLAYALNTTPLPLQVSPPPPEPPTLGMLTFVVSNPGAEAVTVSRITFALVLGDPSKPDATDLMETTEGIGVSAVSTGTDLWTIDPGIAPGTYVLTPQSPTPVLSQGLIVTISNIQIGPVVGTTPITITEVASTASQPSQVRTSTVDTPKFPLEFSAGNFIPVAPIIPYDTTASLTWTASAGASYTVAYGGTTYPASGPLPWVTPTPLTETTVFVLQVTGSYNDQKLTLYFSTVVVVATPDATLESLTVIGTSQLTSLTASAAVQAGSLTVTGASQLASLTASGAVQAGSLTVTGASQLDGAVTIGTASAPTTLTLNGTVQGNLGVSGAVTGGGLSSSGPVFAPALQRGQGGGGPLIGDDNGYYFLFKWTSQPGVSPMSIQIFNWDTAIDPNQQQWGGITFTPFKYKTFVISHPLRAQHYLVHATLEGPEAAVYYRGTAQLEHGRAEIRLPEYFEALTQAEGRTVQLTNVNGFDRLAVHAPDGRAIVDGRFTVVSDRGDSSQTFYWEVKAVRRDGTPLTVEPRCDALDVVSFGPYAVGLERKPGG